MSSIFKIFAKEDCDFYYDGELKGHIIGNCDKAFRFEVERKGSYRVKFVNTRYKSELRMNLCIEADEELDVDLDFSGVNTSDVIANAEAKRLFLQTKAKEVRSQYDSDALIIVEWEGLYGFMDTEGNEVVPCIYHNADHFQYGYARVYLDGKWGLVDKNGLEVLPCKYSDTGVCTEGMACVKINGKWGYVDIETGEELVIGKYDYVYIFCEGIARVEKNNKYGFIDKTGKEIAPCIYGGSYFFREGFAAVTRSGKCGYIDKNGKEVIPLIYENVRDFIDGFAPVQKNGKWGFVDYFGREVIPCIYDGGEIFDVEHYFIEGVATVKKNEKWGFVDKNGEEVVPCIYDTLFSPYGGRAFFGRMTSENDYIHGYVDMSGQEELC